MTIDTRRNVGYEGPRTFSGSRASLGLIGDGFLSLSIPLMLIFTIDLPFSLVADTLLLPLTIPEESERRRVLATDARIDTDVAGPVIPLPDMSHDHNAELLFKRCVRFLERFDPHAVDCYAVGARIVAGPDTFTGSEYKRVLRENLSLLEDEGGHVSFTQPEYQVVGASVHIEARFVSSFAERDARVSLVVARGTDGYWRIVEQTGPDWP
jgi:uncharacterized protein YceK